MTEGWISFTIDDTEQQGEEETKDNTLGIALGCSGGGVALIIGIVIGIKYFK